MAYEVIVVDEFYGDNTFRGSFTDERAAERLKASIEEEIAEDKEEDVHVEIREVP